jgi:hypothetical protein
MSTNELVRQLCAEFIPATRAAKQNHRLTVGHQENHDSPRFLMPFRADCVPLLLHRLRPIHLSKAPDSPRGGNEFSDFRLTTIVV